MTSKTTVTINVGQTLFKTPGTPQLSTTQPIAGRLSLPIQSKRSLTYVANPVGRTTSSDSTDVSPTLSERSIVDSPKSVKAPFIDITNESENLASNTASKRVNRKQGRLVRKSVSWAPVCRIKVIDDKATEGVHEAEKFVNKLQKSPKHADTIYVYEKASFSTTDDEDVAGGSETDDSSGFNFLNYRQSMPSEGFDNDDQ